MARRPRTTPRASGLGPALAVASGLLAIAGCGSASVAELPPAAGPDPSPPLSVRPLGTVTRDGTRRPPPRPSLFVPVRDNGLRVRLDPRARTLTLLDASPARPLATIPVGVGPTGVACNDDGPCFVVDTQGDALLVVRVAEDGDDLRLVRRTYVAGAPYAIAIDRTRKRLWLTLTARNELVELGAHGRPHILRRHPTVRGPLAVAVDEGSGDVTVWGAGGEVQRIADPASPDR